MSDSPSFYLSGESSAYALLTPFLDRASDLLDDILDVVPAIPDRIKGLFDFAESRELPVSL